MKIHFYGFPVNSTKSIL